MSPTASETLENRNPLVSLIGLMEDARIPGRHKDGPRRQRAACRQGLHSLGPEQPIGGGIVRQTCQVCGSVTIDISNADDPPRVSGLFGADRQVGSILGSVMPKPRQRR